MHTYECLLVESRGFAHQHANIKTHRITQGDQHLNGDSVLPFNVRSTVERATPERSATSSNVQLWRAF